MRVCKKYIVHQSRRRMPENHTLRTVGWLHFSELLQIQLEGVDSRCFISSVIDVCLGQSPGPDP